MLGVRKYGTDFAPIAEVIGNKMASHVRSFFVTYRQRFCLDDVLRDNKHDLSSVRMNKTGDGQPVEVTLHLCDVSLDKCCIMKQT